MSSRSTDGAPVEDKEREFEKLVRETFAPHTKSKQYRYDHPEGDLPREVTQNQPPHPDPHNDGQDIYQSFALEPLPKYLTRAAKHDHAVAQHPKALAHFLTHIKKWEKWELGEPDPYFEDIPGKRRELFEWYAGVGAEDPPEAQSRRTKRLRPGGTGMVLHGEQGTTKTTAMYWLITNIMEVNQNENIIWQSTLDDTEWQIFGGWATVCLPVGVDVSVTANPHGREYRDVGAFEMGPDTIARQVIRYENFADLLEQMADRQPGQIYVVYPDPYFRKQQARTGWEYESIWEVEESDEATDLNHNWFALMDEIQSNPVYNHWTTLVGDEAHKWLRQGASDDQHDWHKKIKDWGTYWGDARKNRLSVLLAVHKWHEIHHFVRDKVRWGATMNGEDFPAAAPIDGKNVYDQDLGDMCVWNNMDWNHVGYPDLKRNFSVPGDIEVSYPGFEAEKEAKS